MRIGNAASTQLQLDVYGELAGRAASGMRAGLDRTHRDLGHQVAFCTHLEKSGGSRTTGIWEVRGPRRHFTHSKVMAWVAFDRAVKRSNNPGWRGR